MIKTCYLVPLCWTIKNPPASGKKSKLPPIEANVLNLQARKDLNGLIPLIGLELLAVQTTARFRPRSVVRCRPSNETLKRIEQEKVAKAHEELATFARRVDERIEHEMRERKQTQNVHDELNSLLLTCHVSALKQLHARLRRRDFSERGWQLIKAYVKSELGRLEPKMWLAERNWILQGEITFAVQRQRSAESSKLAA
ncbi:hypothetical protein GF380_06115 [Candidatus Uhrbacteria bacterium]|nr:hypothetical protein [Candidatus Uhrbacteria bacterium]